LGLVNSTKLIGKSAIFDLQEKCLFSNHFTRIRINPKLISSEWLLLNIQKHWMEGLFSQICHKWVNQSGIRTEQIKKIPILVLPIKTQNEIITKANSLFNRISLLSKNMNEIRNNLLIIYPNVVRKTFDPKNYQNWTFSKLKPLIVDLKNGLYKPKKFYGKGIPSLRMYNIEHGFLNKKNLHYVDVNDEELSMYGLIENDILFNRVNSTELVGKCAIVPKNFGSATFESKNIRIRIDENKIDPHFLNHFINSQYARKQFKIKEHIGQSSINQKSLNNLEIWYPERKEQEKISQNLNNIQLLTYAAQKKLKEQLEMIPILYKLVIDQGISPPKGKK